MNTFGTAKLNKVRVKLWLFLAIGAVAAIVFVGLSGLPKEKNMATSAPVTIPASSNPADYTLKLISGTAYPVRSSQNISFTVEREGKTVRDFDTVHEEDMHLITVRKDRTQFQHIHPKFDAATGVFTVERFGFATDGEYRIFANFTLSNAAVDGMGKKTPVTVFQDITVGNKSTYVPKGVGPDSFADSANDIDTRLFASPGHSTPSTDAPIHSGTMISLIVLFDKNGQPFTKMQPYLGALGHMVILGPNLEFIHAYADDVGAAPQTGALTFSVTLPKLGQYKLFLQTQADGVVNTTDYTVTASVEHKQQ